MQDLPLASLPASLDRLHSLQARGSVCCDGWMCGGVQGGCRDSLPTQPPPPEPPRQHRRLQPTPAQATQLEDALQGLLHPGGLEALPLVLQTNLLLLLRLSPHRFTSAQRTAVLRRAAAVDTCSGTSGLLQSLAASVQDDCQHPSAAALAAAAPVPACPDFLFTAQPCFPWAPSLASATDAAALHRRQQKQQRADAGAAAAEAGAKRPADAEVAAEEQAGAANKHPRLSAAATVAATPAATPAAAAEAELEAAVEIVRAALAFHAGGAAPLVAVPPPLRAALEALLAADAAGGSDEACEASGLGALGDDPLLLLLLNELITPASSYARCAAAAGGLLLPRLRALDAPASRDLAAAVELIGGRRSLLLLQGADA